MPKEQGQFSGQKVAEYQIGDRIGKGGMGEVYLASYFHQHEQIVVKFLLEDGSKLLTNKDIALFEKEAQVHSTLVHPNIVTFHRFGVHEHNQKRSPYIAMEYAPEGSLQDEINKRGMLSTDDAVDVMQQLSDAVQYAHDKGVVHRDIKPHNLLIVRERRSGNKVLLLSDFGITATAHTIHTDPKDISGMQEGIGTPAYMPAEQFQRKAIIPSDIYTEGIVLFQLVTNELPFRREGYEEYFVAHLMEPVPDINAVRRSKGLALSEPVDAIAEVVGKALQKNPKDRYQSAGAFKQDLEEKYTKAKERAKRDIYYSLSEQLRIHGIDPQSIVTPTLSLDEQLNQLHTVVVQGLQQELVGERTQNQQQAHVLSAKDQDNVQLQQEVSTLSNALGEEQRKNSGLQEVLGYKESILEQTKNRVKHLETVSLSEQQELDKANTANQSLKEQNLLLTEQLSERTAQVQEVEKDLQYTRQENTKLREELVRSTATQQQQPIVPESSIFTIPTILMFPENLGQNREFVTPEIQREPSVEIFRGHTDMVGSVSWSPDGKQIASGSSDKSVRIWDAATGKQLTELAGHNDTVYSVSWSPDGKRIVSGSKDNTVRIWDAVTGKQLTELIGHTDIVRSVSWSPDGKRIASGGNDTVRIWDAVTGKQLTELAGHERFVYSVSWSPDGKRIASGSFDNTVRVWTI